MHTKAIVHIMTKSRMESDVFLPDIDAMKKISKKYSIKNFIFYKGEKIDFEDLSSKLEKVGIFLYNYSNKKDLINQVTELNKNFEIEFVNTTLELLVNIANEVKKYLGQKLTINPKIFRNKFLQRKLIQKHSPDLAVKFIKSSIENLNIDEIEKTINYPFIIKPIDGVQSSGVAKIKNREDYEKYLRTYNGFHDRLEARGINNKELLFEEFVDGTLYSIDYYVNQNGDIFLTKPVKQRLLSDLKFDDYGVLARISSKKTEGEFNPKKIKSFVESSVIAMGIKNSFIHHEFKKNSKGELKTIEINGRIGGGRLELMKKAYNLNIYELLLNANFKMPKLKENNIVVNIYSTKRGILSSFNHKLIEKIRLKKSVYEIDLKESAVGKEIGLTKDGFVKIGAIKMCNKDYQELASDFDFIKKHYGDLLIID